MNKSGRLSSSAVQFDQELASCFAYLEPFQSRVRQIELLQSLEILTAMCTCYPPGQFNADNPYGIISAVTRQGNDTLRRGSTNLNCFFVILRPRTLHRLLDILMSGHDWKGSTLSLATFNPCCLLCATQLCVPVAFRSVKVHLTFVNCHSARNEKCCNLALVNHLTPLESEARMHLHCLTRQKRCHGSV